MPEPRSVRPHQVDVAAAAELLAVDVATVEALVAAGYLRPTPGPSGTEFVVADLRAFVARNAADGAGYLSLDAMLDTSTADDFGGLADLDEADPQALLDALDGRSDEMARRTLEIFATVFPEASGWSPPERDQFIEQARNRFEAILAVAGQGAAVDEALVGDLQEVGAAAAVASSPLPQLLVILRISRDLVVQTAVGLAEKRGRHWGLALSLLLTRILPSMDRLTDALAQGYWAALGARGEELSAMYAHVTENSSDGLFEVDLDGRLRFANQALGIVLGEDPDDLVDRVLSDVLIPESDRDGVDVLLHDPSARDGDVLELSIVRADGVRRVVEVRVTARYRFGEVVGHQGFVRDVTGPLEFEAARREFLALVSHDLRQPLATLLGQGANLEAHGSELPPEQVARIGAAIRRQVERIARLADDIGDLAQLESSQLVLNTRPVDLAQVIHAAIGSVHTPSEVEVRIPDGIAVLTDPRRLEQVVANVVDNGLEHGRGPIVVEWCVSDAATVEFTVTDQGPGVPPERVPTLFAGLRTPHRRPGQRARGSGVGLALAKGLLELMGGRIAYEAGDPTGGAVPSLVVPVPRRRRLDDELDVDLT